MPYYLWGGGYNLLLKADSNPSLAPDDFSIDYSIKDLLDYNPKEYNQALLEFKQSQDQLFEAKRDFLDQQINRLQPIMDDFNAKSKKGWDMYVKYYPDKGPINDLAKKIKAEILGTLKGNGVSFHNANNDLSQMLTEINWYALTTANKKYGEGLIDGLKDNLLTLQTYLTELKYTKNDLDSLAKTHPSSIPSNKDTPTAFYNLQEKINTLSKQVNEKLLKLSKLMGVKQFHQAAIKTIHSDQKKLSSLNQGVLRSTQMVNFISSLNAQTRLAKLSNPHQENIQFAEWIKSMQGKAMASNDIPTNTLLLAANNQNNSHQVNFNNKKVPTNPKSDAIAYSVSNKAYLSNGIYSYDALRFNAMNNLWINLGAISGESNGVDNVSGILSVGYDAWVKNMILGAYGSYAYGTDSIDNGSSKNQSHTGDFGFYSRFFLQNNEIDFNLGENIAYHSMSLKNDLFHTIFSGNNLGFQTHLDLTYGYVFDLSKGWFSKPFISLGYAYGYNTAMNSTSQDTSLENIASINTAAYQTHYFSTQIGLEFRKYFNDNNSYFYVSPAYYQGVLFSQDQSVNSNFYSKDFYSPIETLGKNHNLETAFVLKGGGEWKASDSIFINASAGVKISGIAKYGSVNIGLKYRF